MPALHLVDAFASQPFRGNPAAVCLLDGPADEKWMQSVAFELGYSETAYVYPRQDGYSLRWFTPAIEVPLCGHATLASAHVLWSLGHTEAALRFHTHSGVLTCTRRGEDIWLDFPRKTLSSARASTALLEALGAVAYDVQRSEAQLLIELADEAAVRALEPDFSALRRAAAADDLRGMMVTARASDAAFDFVSRYFAPGAGIDEDPVTGSAHCALTPYWAEKLGKPAMRALQVSKRSGVVQVELAGERVHLGGQAVTTLRGDLLL